MRNTNQTTMSNRHGRAEDIVKRTLAEAIVERLETRHPEYGIVSVVSVDISSDHSYADVGVRSTDATDELVKTLTHDASEYRKVLAKSLPMRRVPVLRFHDHSLAKSPDDIYALLDRVSRESLPADETA
ncbi:MAG TPA: ribosome-binding factor A [bacterium]|nr:ribosome-binding factor A [bacterium]